MDTGAPRIIAGKPHNIGNLSIVRVLPTRHQRSVGPFVFVDHMAPPPGARPCIDVAPHPHIGIATVTYLFDGVILHQDSLGTTQVIEPGAVNWMTSGRGIVHSERTPPHLRAAPPPLFGVQCWVALPKHSEESEPRFEHYPASLLPEFDEGKVRVRLIAGALLGRRSPVRTDSPLLCAALEFQEGGEVCLPGAGEERGLVVLSGSARVGGGDISPGQMAVWEGEEGLTVVAEVPTRAFLLGGPRLPERRYMDWNFVATDPALIARAKDLYREKKLGIIAGESEQLGLPEDVR